MSPVTQAQRRLLVAAVAHKIDNLNSHGELATICARLDRAQVAGDIEMIYACRRAISDDAHDLQVWRDRSEMERLIGVLP